MTDSHRNDERTVRCPVEGCETEVLARGIHLHIRQTAYAGHGPQGVVPDHISLDDLETVGEAEVEMDYPEERDTEQTARLCPYCSKPYKGGQGVLIHLGQVAGRKNHPEDAAEKHDETDFPKVKVDEQGNLIEVLDGSPTDDRADSGGAGVSKDRVYRFITDLIAGGDMAMAHRVRKELLGVEPANRPVREDVPGVNMYQALLTHRRAEDEDDHLTAVVEPGGIKVECGDASEFYTAGQARDVAARLEQVREILPDGSDVPRLIEFLRHGASILEGDQPVENTPLEFEDWRR